MTSTFILQMSKLNNGGQAQTKLVAYLFRKLRLTFLNPF